MDYDLIILGGGPAGAGAGVYAARKKLHTALLTKEFGGQSVVSEDIQNWLGSPSISGEELAKSFRKHLETYAGDIVAIKEGEEIQSVSEIDGGFQVETSGGVHTARAILVATGSHRRKLNIPGAKEYDNKGITYCASCDGPLFADKDVVVVGGGNAAFETAAQLLAYTKSVTLLNRSGEFKADPVTVEKVLKHPKMTALKHTEPIEIKGEKFVSGIVYKNTETGEQTEKSVEGIFVEIGAIPTTDFVKTLVALNNFGAVEIDPWTQQTSKAGIWAAGDCTNVRYHQNNISAGDGVRALEDIFNWLHAK
ncbi:MAG: hypothetical protein COW88_00430 [Candidatus Lloydbacteria bacterium CG22_combo_CG10-13_8_21_14_all_47_15]|uniref:FAD/NAD(P)-binding domain-containing protein n=1 Tax=Candidatus Lloydbacteria bacterium CG22_combo_CG10-13_8_21_14_all_47_15 TaxID=1974635 RepID=A0A2H0CX03_9BACT|nr:MAG: hypothetical protein COW88_00430 [Candidatus Lloydbacteria bacterium CG22_combo_CG10-13_8_21_14_all_47_15]